MFCLSTPCFLCTFHRLKSRPFKVMPGLQMTRNPPLRSTVKSTRHLISSSPLEGSRLFWVTLKYQVGQNHRPLCSIFITWFSGIQKKFVGWWLQGQLWVLPVMVFSNWNLFQSKIGISHYTLRFKAWFYYEIIFSSHQTQCCCWCGLYCSGDGGHPFHSRI